MNKFYLLSLSTLKSWNAQQFAKPSDFATQLQVENPGNVLPYYFWLPAVPANESLTNPGEGFSAVAFDQGAIDRVVAYFPQLGNHSLSFVVLTEGGTAVQTSLRDLESKGIQLLWHPADTTTAAIVQAARQLQQVVPAGTKVISVAPKVEVAPQPTPQPQSVPTPQPALTDYVIEPIEGSQDRWYITPQERTALENIVNHLTQLLGALNPDKREVKLLFDTQYHGYWLAAFTRRTYDYNTRHNMEVWEKIGDTVMKLYFQQMLIDNYPHLTHSDISDLVENSLEAKSQADAARALGLNKLVLTPLSQDYLKLAEDTIESMFGVMFKVANMVKDQHPKIKFSGKDYAKIFIEKIYKAKLEQNLIPASEQLGSGFKNNPSNQVKETFQKLGYGDILDRLVQFSGSQRNLKIKLEIPVEIYNDLVQKKYINSKFLNKPGPQAASPILAELDARPGEDNNLLKARAFLEARNKLAAWGLSIQDASKVQLQSVKRLLEQAGLLQGMQQLMLNEGYDPDTFMFKRTKTFIENKQYFLWQLITQKQNSQEYKILIGRLYTDNSSYTKDLVDRYVNRGERGTNATPP